MEANNPTENLTTTSEVDFDSLLLHQSDPQTLFDACLSALKGSPRAMRELINEGLKGDKFGHDQDIAKRFTTLMLLSSLYLSKDLKNFPQNCLELIDLIDPNLAVSHDSDHDTLVHRGLKMSLHEDIQAVVVEEKLLQQCDMSVRDSHGNNIILRIAYSCNLAILELALKLMIDKIEINECSHFGSTLLVTLLNQQCLTLFEFVWKRKVDQIVFEKHKFDTLILIDLILRSKSVNTIKLFFELLPEREFQPKNVAQSSIHEALKTQNEEVEQLIIEKFNIFDSEYIAIGSLFCNSVRFFRPIAQKLLDSHKEKLLSAKFPKKSTLVNYVCENCADSDFVLNFLKTIPSAVLVEQINSPDIANNRPISSALRYGNHKAVRYIIETCAEVLDIDFMSTRSRNTYFLTELVSWYAKGENFFDLAQKMGHDRDALARNNPKILIEVITRRPGELDMACQFFIEQPELFNEEVVKSVLQSQNEQVFDTLLKYFRVQFHAMVRQTNARMILKDLFSKYVSASLRGQIGHHIRTSKSALNLMDSSPPFILHVLNSMFMIVENRKLTGTDPSFLDLSYFYMNARRVVETKRRMIQIKQQNQSKILEGLSFNLIRAIGSYL